MVTANLGFPRIGAQRELKFALERYWSGEFSEAQLQATARDLRRTHWQMQVAAGIDCIPSNDFSLYDHVLDNAVMVGAVPERFGRHDGPISLATYFAMARGGPSASAMEMTKWFDTNYHYIVPEFETGMEFRLASDKPVREFIEAKAAGMMTRPVLLGPVSFALLGKSRNARLDRAAVAGELIEVYRALFTRLAAAGAEWIQLDEPYLGLDLHDTERTLYVHTYERLATSDSGLKLLLATYFSALGDNLELALHLPVHGMHLDLIRGPEQLAPSLAQAAATLTLSLGLVDGRNIWRADLNHALGVLRTAADRLGPERVQIAPSCSLLHVPVDLDQENFLDPELRSWMAFAKQKLDEVALLARAITDTPAELTEQLDENRRILERRRSSPRVCNPEVRTRAASVNIAMLSRHDTFAIRRAGQAKAMPLPPLPTTAIGSFPQTPEIRRARAAFRSGQLTKIEYEWFLRVEIERAIRFQEEIGLDVLVHGEFERNDMVEYFGEQLDGFAFTRHGWVQSYGSRCVKPPILFGDVLRPAPMSVAWSRYAQSLTRLPVKGMLTGPVTMLQWSFVRDDLPRAETCRQLALALRDEVKDLESAGLRVIQVDEPALREGLPLRQADRPEYLRWSVAGFRLATAVAGDETQIHTHMCYSEFGEILRAIKEIDADVISIEAARSRMELLDELAPGAYPNDIGPGIYDIHAPRVPDVAEFEVLIRKALQVFRPEQLWVNPDCGLKTRRWQEVRPALANMVLAARRIRNALGRRPGPVASAGGSTAA